jgi:hypothetical protein
VTKSVKKAEININLSYGTCLICQQTALDLGKIGRFFHRMDGYSFPACVGVPSSAGKQRPRTGMAS